MSHFLTAPLECCSGAPSGNCSHIGQGAASTTSPWHGTAGPNRAVSNPKEPASHRPWQKLTWSPSGSADSLIFSPTSYLCCCQADFRGEKQSLWSRIFTVWVETCLWGGVGIILMHCQMALSVSTGAYGASHTIARELQFSDVFPLLSCSPDAKVSRCMKAGCSCCASWTFHLPITALGWILNRQQMRSASTLSGPRGYSISGIWMEKETENPWY